MSRVPQAKLILASASPQRSQLLRRAGLAPSVIPCHYEEPTRRPAGVSPRAWAESLAYFKARAVAERCPGEIVLGADTVVVCDDVLLGKPLDRSDAERMLRQQAGRASDVITGFALVCLDCPGRDGIAAVRRRIHSARTRVWMKHDENAIREYLESGEWAGKAGAYGIQDVGDRLIERIDGDFDNVVGLPVALVLRAFALFQDVPAMPC